MLKRLSERVWQADEADARKTCEGYSPKWKELGISAILCPAFNVRIPYHPKLAAMILPVWDETDAPEWMFDTAVFFHRKMGPTLVHCHGGLNRSSAFAAALLVEEGIEVQEALKAVNATPRPELLGSLLRWVNRRKP